MPEILVAVSKQDPQLELCIRDTEETNLLCAIIATRLYEDIHEKKCRHGLLFLIIVWCNMRGIGLRQNVRADTGVE